MEADRVWNSMSAPAKDVLHRHATLGTYMAVVFGVLAVWRILIEAIGFFAGSREQPSTVAAAAPTAVAPAPAGKEFTQNSELRTQNSELRTEICNLQFAICNLKTEDLCWEYFYWRSW